MIEVTKKQITEYNKDSQHKSLIVRFPNIGLTLDKSQIYSESMKLKESLVEGNNIEFVGCIASQFALQVHDVTQNLKNAYIEVAIKTDDTDEIPLFHGIVDSAKMQTNRSFKDITAYDLLYTKGQKDVAEWYQGLTFPISLKDLRNSLFSYIGLTQVEVELPNDWVMIDKQYDPKTLKCLTVIKSLCQFNGCFGIINRYGLFEYRFLHNSDDMLIPSTDLYPAEDLYPTEFNPTQVANSFGYYKQIEYEEYMVKPVDRLQIRQSEDDAGIIVGNATGNKYIIQNNMFARKLDAETLVNVGNNIWSKIYNIVFHPCNTNNNGLPYVEVGDVVEYALQSQSRSADAGTNSFNVMSRELSGIQALRDNYQAEGEEEQSEFITDLQAQIDTIKTNGGGNPDLENYYTKDEVDLLIEDYVDTAIEEMETPTGFTVVSCYTLPTARQADTIYLVQSDLVVVK